MLRYLLGYEKKKNTEMIRIHRMNLNSCRKERTKLTNGEVGKEMRSL